MFTLVLGVDVLRVNREIVPLSLCETETFIVGSALTSFCLVSCLLYLEEGRTRVFQSTELATYFAIGFVR